MHGTLPMHLSPRCGAYARRTGKPCRNGAMANGRCRMHGGKNPGAPRGNVNAYLHGRYSARVIAETAALHEKANALVVEAIRARSDVARKLHRGDLSPREAEKRYEAIKAKWPMLSRCGKRPSR